MSRRRVLLLICLVGTWLLVRSGVAGEVGLPMPDAPWTRAPAPAGSAGGGADPDSGAPLPKGGDGRERASPVGTSVPPEGRECRIRSVHDGDSVRCEDGTRVRLLGIDAPELGQAPFGRASRDSLRALIPSGATVRLVHDVRRTDRYRRVLAHVFTAEGVHVNRAMVRRGYAVPLSIPPNVRYRDEIRSAATEAQEERVGLWAQDGFRCAPRDYRARRCGGRAARSGIPR